MDTSYTYPQLFDDTNFDTDLFGGLNLSDNYLDTNNKKLDYASSLHQQNSSYLQYLQNNHNEFYYDTASQQMLLLPPPQQQPPTIDLADYDYFNTTSPTTLTDEKQYNWLYDPIDTTNYLPTQHNLFNDDTLGQMSQLDSIMSDHIDDITTVQGGMSRGYVSLSDVNSFVAKADSKHSLQVPNDFTGRTDFSSSESTTNEDSEDDYSDSENELRWPSFDATNKQQKLMIKIKKPTPPTYGGEQWLISPKSKASVYRNKYRKSMSSIFLNSHVGGGGKKNKLVDGKRRGSAPHRLTNHSLHSSSSLTSLSNSLQRSMRVSDSMNFLSKHSSDEEEEEEEEEDDDEYQIRSANAPHHQIPTKKGRNVDKACNHCKRSHLRCDDMRPCRRCVATGKTGCKDVQHKPRGRPKLHKK